MPKQKRVYRPKTAYHRPLSMRVQKIGRVPDERELPTETEMTINFSFTREKAKEMIDYLNKELESEWLKIIRVEIIGPSP
jgi:hypothetical protein